MRHNSETPFRIGRLTLHSLRLALLIFLAAPTVQAATLLEREGALGPGSEQLQTGELAEAFQVAIPAGQLIEARLQGEGFDPYLIAALPTGGKLLNDNFEGADSLISFVSPRAGDLGLVVTSAKAGTTGSFRLVVEASPPNGPLTVVLDRDAVLQPGGPTLPGGELHQNLQVNCKAGQILRARLDSEDFDPYLAISIDGRSALENNDFQSTSAEVSCRVPADGMVGVVATTRQPGQSGAYHLTIQTDRNGAILMSTPGELKADSPKLPDGESYAVHRLPVEAGQQLRVRLQPTGFEGYLVLIPPGGKQADARSQDDGPVTAQVTCPEAGLLQVVVTSVQPGAQGRYTLDIRPGRGAPPPAAADPASTNDVPAANGERPSLESIQSGSPDFNPRDPKLRLPKPEPAAGTVQNPGLLADTLFHRPAVWIELSGRHHWSDTAYEYDDQGKKREEDKSGPAHGRLEVYNHHFDAAETPGWDGQLKWYGNTFVGYWAVELRKPVWAGQPYEYESRTLQVCDVTGVMAPSGDAIEYLTIEYYQDWVTVAKQDGKHEYKRQESTRLVLQDVPFDGTAWFGPYDRLENPSSLAETVARQKRKQPEAMQWLEYYYRIKGPEAAKRVLKFEHTTWEPAFGAQSMFGGNLAKRDYQRTEWLNTDDVPELTVKFYVPQP